VFVLCDLLALPLLTLYVRQHQVEPYRIPSSSMAPSVRAGDMIWADKRYNCPGCKRGVHRGDIAIFAYPNDRSVSYIKRVIGLPGDQVVLRDRQVWVNGQALLRAGVSPADGVVTEALDGRQWQVQWVDVPVSTQPAAVAPPLNRVSGRARGELVAAGAGVAVSSHQIRAERYGESRDFVEQSAT
jgi:signal peptidase I